MNLDPRAIAVQGIGYGPAATALQGFVRVSLFVVIPGGGGSAGKASYRKIKESVFEIDDTDLITQIHKQDDEVLAIIMMAVIRGDVL